MIETNVETFLCICRLAKWFKDRAFYDVARGDVFRKISGAYIAAASDYLRFVESDHLATILLEVKSDIDGMSALDMALEYGLTGFVANNRVERVTTSIMQNFEFMRPANRAEAFEIAPLSIPLVFRKMRRWQFFFTPLGTYVCTVFLYLLYLGLFTYLSVQQYRVYDEVTDSELLFWVFIAGVLFSSCASHICSGHF